MFRSVKGPQESVYRVIHYTVSTEENISPLTLHNKVPKRTKEMVKNLVKYNNIPLFSSLSYVSWLKVKNYNIV